MKIRPIFVPLILFMLLLYWPTPTPGETRQEQQNLSSPKAKLANDNQQNPQKFSSSLNKTTPPRSEPKETNNPQNCHNKPSTNWWTITFSALLVIFNGLLAFFTCRLYQSTKKLWIATEKTANAAKKSADVLYATERPYIHADVKVVSGGLKEGVYTIKIQFRVWNYGKTPAIIRWIKILHNGEPKIPDGPDESVFPRKFGLCMLSKGTPFIETVPIYMKRQDWENVDTHEATKSIFLLIRVEYTDVFGNPDTKDFWWVYKPIDHVWSMYEYPKQK